MADMGINELRALQLEKVEQMKALEARAQQEERDLSEEEATEYDELLVAAQNLDNRIGRLEQLAKFENKLGQSQGRKTEGTVTGSSATFRDGAKVSGGTPGYARDTKWGFKNRAEWLQSVIRAGKNGHDRDQRLFAGAATTYGTEGDTESGGFAVPPDFRPGIIKLIEGEGSLLARTDRQITTSNSMTFPVDDVSPWNTSEGVQVYWESEAGAKTQSKPHGEPWTVRLGKMVCLVPLSDELIDDAPGLETWLTSKVPDKMDWKINQGLIRGDGVAKLLGVLNSGSLVTVAAESGQAADTLLVENLWNMYSRMYAPCRATAVWHINQDVEPQLFGLKMTGSNGYFYPVYIPPGGVSSTPYGTLFGRPVIPSQACSTVGDAGDVLLVDWSKYLTLTKVGGPQTMLSVHFFFDQDITAMRVVFRVNGAPWWKKALTPAYSSNTLSWAVALETRS